MFLIREARSQDFPGVYPLARMLDSYNLPADPSYVKELLRISERSFLGEVAKAKAKYLFVLETPSPTPPHPVLLPPGGEKVRLRGVRGRIVGCSLIITKHGTPGRPHLWFGMETIRKHSKTLRIHREHPVLRLGATTDGPTQVGGLAVLPSFRDHPAHCGLQLSYVRFLYMAMHPKRFEDEVLVEYRGISTGGNRSPFWEAVGSVFTGLSYKKADRLSVTNKEFIFGLMPKEPIYAQLLPKSVQRTIGAIHPAARKAVRLLERIGFHPIAQVEPFDAGRYYAARLREIRVVRKTRRVQVAVVPRQARDERVGQGERRVRGGLCLIGADRGGFRAVLAKAALGKDRCGLEPETLELLRLKRGDPVYACPI